MNPLSVQSSGLVLIIICMLAGTAGAGRKPAPEVDLKRLLKLKPGEVLSKTGLLQRIRAMKEGAGHIFYDSKGRADARHFRKLRASLKRKTPRIKKRRRMKQRQLKADKIFARMGKALGGKIGRKGFRMGRLMFGKLDVLNRGYVTITDVKELLRTAPYLNARKKAARFIKQNDKNGDNRLTRAEVRGPKARAGLSRCKADSKGYHTLQGLAECLAELARKGRAKRKITIKQRRSRRQP